MRTSWLGTGTSIMDRETFARLIYLVGSHCGVPATRHFYLMKAKDGVGTRKGAKVGRERGRVWCWDLTRCDVSLTEVTQRKVGRFISSRGKRRHKSRENPTPSPHLYWYGYPCGPDGACGLPLLESPAAGDDVSSGWVELLGFRRSVPRFLS